MTPARRGQSERRSPAEPQTTAERKGKAERTRERILAVAAALFAQRSMDQVSVRAIARTADVDPALVHHYFGTKEDLFSTVLEQTIRPDQIARTITADDPSEWGCAMVRAAEAVWTSPAGPALFAAVRRSLASHSEVMNRFVTRALLPRIAAELDAPEPERELRASLVSSQMAGLLITRHLLRLEPLASLPTDDVIRLVGPAVQRYLTGPLCLGGADETALGEMAGTTAEAE